MTVLKLTSMAAVVAIAVAATQATGSDLAQTPEQRALALALSLADQARQQPKAAVVNGSAQTAPAALAAGVASATGSAK